LRQHSQNEEPTSTLHHYALVGLDYVSANDEGHDCLAVLSFSFFAGWGTPMGDTDHPTGDGARQATLDDEPMFAGFVAELRRRGVLRAVLAYAIVAFAVLQVVEPVLHGLRTPTRS
jgi:hypothetical protein